MADYSKFILSEQQKAAIANGSFLVTGGAGFIGSNIVDALLQAGARKVRVFDNLSTGFRENITAFERFTQFEFIEGDIRDIGQCLQACEDITYISHQAALGSVPRSIDDPITTNQVNIGGHLNMLVACREKKVKRMVYAASSSTYGDSIELPKSEERIGKPLSPYAVTKYVNELYAEVFYKTYQIETIGLRYFNVFGPRQDPRGAYAAVIPLFMDAVIKNQSPSINGDGEQTRDFTYVDNAVYANLLAMIIQTPEAINQVYNIAVGEQISLNDLFEKMKVISSKQSLQATYRTQRKGDVRNSLADISKAANLLGYTPLIKVTEGLEKTFEFWQKQH